MAGAWSEGRTATGRRSLPSTKSGQRRPSLTRSAPRVRVRNPWACRGERSLVQEVTRIDRPFALQIRDQRKEQRQAEQKAADGVCEPVPAEVDDAVSDKEDHQHQHGAQPRAIPAKELPALSQIEHQAVRQRRPDHVAAGKRVLANPVAPRWQEVREPLYYLAGSGADDHLLPEDLES